MSCSLCSRSDVAAINRELDAGKSYREIQDAFAVSLGSLSRHSQHRLDEPETGETVSALLQTIRDEIEQHYAAQLHEQQQELTTAQERLAQGRMQLESANTQAWQAAAWLSQARELAQYPPFKPPRSITPRSLKDEYLHPYWDMLTTRQTALEQACTHLDRALAAHEGATNGVRRQEQTVQRLKTELAGHRERLTKPESLTLANELVQYTAALQSAQTQQQPQALRAHLEAEVEQRRNALLGRAITP